MKLSLTIKNSNFYTKNKFNFIILYDVGKNRLEVLIKNF